MMLLQAGQMGLYRKDSIWTDELPPGNGGQFQLGSVEGG